MRCVERCRWQVHQVFCLYFRMKSDCCSASLGPLATGSSLRFLYQAIIFDIRLLLDLFIIKAVLDWVCCIRCAWGWSVHRPQLLYSLSTLCALATLKLTWALLLLCCCWRSSLELGTLECATLFHDLRFWASLLLLLIEVTYEVRRSRG